MFGSDLNIYGSDFKSIYHSDLLIHQFYPVAHPFTTMALYTHVETIPLVFVSPYDNNYDISESIKPHFRIGKVLYQFGRKICGLVHHFVAIQGTDCIEYFTLWERVCTYLFSFNVYVFRSGYVGIKKHSYNSLP